MNPVLYTQLFNWVGQLGRVGGSSVLKLLSCKAPVQLWLKPFKQHAGAAMYTQLLPKCSVKPVPDAADGMLHVQVMGRMWYGINPYTLYSATATTPQ